MTDPHRARWATGVLTGDRSFHKHKGNLVTLDEIKAAVDAGKPVHWSHTGYQVIKDRLGQYLIKCLHNDNCIGLTWQDGVTMNGKPEEFFVLGDETDGDEDICEKSTDGKHDPDPTTLTVTHDGDQAYIDVSCRLCGRSGCAGKFDPDSVDW